MMLTSNNATVWYLSPCEIGPREEFRLAEVLSKKERIHAARLRVRQDQAAYIAAHGVKRLMLAHFLQRSPQELRFVTSEFGKPELAQDAGAPAVRYNLTRTRGMVALALTIQSDIGVDVEPIVRTVSFDDLVEFALSEREQAWLNSKPAGRTENFLALWTLKEAYAKATGQGLSIPLKSCSFDLRGQNVTLNSHGGQEAAQWCFKQLILGTDHLLALAMRPNLPSQFRVNIKQAPLGDIL